MSGPNEYNRHIIEQFRVNGGNTDFHGPVLLLTTTGATSGQPHTTPLGYASDSNRLYALVARLCRLSGENHPADPGHHPDTHP